MLRFRHTKKGSAQARKARKKIKTIADRLQRELRRNLSDVEFGSKSSILITQNTGVIVGALNFNENIHDSKTLEPVLEQYERLNDRKPKEVYADRGYRGRKYVNDVAIREFQRQIKNITKAQRKKYRCRAAIEPVISHLKFDCRLVRNFLKGSAGDSMNLLLSAAAFNFKRVMNLWRTEETYCWQLLHLFTNAVYGIFLSKKLKMTF